MTNDDAKYLEWWEKLKAWLAHESKPTGPDIILSKVVMGQVLYKMLQIEQGGEMKRKILEITEIDCGEENCDGCRFRWDLGMAPDACDRFGSPIDEKDGKTKRLPECLEAERMHFQYVGYSEMAKAYVEGMEKTTIVVTPTKKAQGPPDSIGE